MARYVDGRDRNGNLRPRKKYRRRRQRRYKKTKKVSKLSDKKINTLVEVRMQEIAKTEIEKQRKLLTSRKYLFHAYNKLTNVFTAITTGSNPAVDESLIDWTGQIVELSNIPQVDIEFETNVPQTDDPLTAINENADGDGSGQGAMDLAMHGRRMSNSIFIQSVSADLRIVCQRLEEDEQPIVNTLQLNYAFVLWRDIEVVMDTVDDAPDPNELLSMSNLIFGYSGKLDPELEIKFHALKKRTLLRGKTSLSLNDIKSGDVYKTIFKKFKSPINIVYQKDSQNGQKCNKKLYFVCRSSVPDAYDAALKPNVFVCTKVNYYEA